MYFHDQRIAQALADHRLEQAASIRRRRSIKGKMTAKQRLGLLLIARGEKLANREAKAT